jgi:hypothetical protein
MRERARSTTHCEHFDFERLPYLNRAVVHELATSRYLGERAPVLVAFPRTASSLQLRSTGCGTTCIAWFLTASRIDHRDFRRQRPSALQTAAKRRILKPDGMSVCPPKSWGQYAEKSRLLSGEK